MKMLLLPLALMVAISAGAQAPAPAGAAQQAAAGTELLRPDGVEGDGYVYVSGQGPRRKDGSMPTGFAQQARQCLENVRGVAETFGLKMDHVVYVQVYLEDVNQYGELNKVFAEYFPKDPPARGILGVARVPESPLEITAVAVRDLTGKQAVNLANGKVDKAFSLGMLTHD
jgi:2-iminobutanoate/2-iminopropanoate deaminase